VPQRGVNGERDHFTRLMFMVVIRAYAEVLSSAFEHQSPELQKLKTSDSRTKIMDEARMEGIEARRIVQLRDYDSALSARQSDPSASISSRWTGC
jgi:hypothetical protein